MPAWLAVYLALALPGLGFYFMAATVAARRDRRNPLEVDPMSNETPTADHSRRLWFFDHWHPEREPVALSAYGAAQPDTFTGPFDTYGQANRARLDFLARSQPDARALLDVPVNHVPEFAPYAWFYNPADLTQAARRVYKGHAEAAGLAGGTDTEGAAEYERREALARAQLREAIEAGSVGPGDYVEFHVYGQQGPERVRLPLPDTARPPADQVSQTTAAMLYGLAYRMSAGETQALSWNVEQEAEPVGLDGDPIRTGRAFLSLAFVELPEADRYREAVAAAKPPEGVALPPLTFERLRLMADIHAETSADGEPVAAHYCGLCDSGLTALPDPIPHAPDCPGPELERLAELARKS